MVRDVSPIIFYRVTSSFCCLICVFSAIGGFIYPYNQLLRVFVPTKVTLITESEEDDKSGFLFHL